MFALALGYILTLPFLAVLLVVGIIMEARDSYMAPYIAVISGVIAFFMYDVPLLTLAYYLGIYLVIGILWSFWRFKRYVDKKVDTYNALTNPTNYNKEMFTKYISLQYASGRIVSWIIVWPFSMIENLVGDIIRVLDSVVTKMLKFVYEMIINNAMGKIKEPSPENK